MAKWADYCISAVRYNSRHTHIDRVQLFPDNGESLGVITEVTRQTVIDEIKRQTTFVTIFKGTASGTWDKGQPVIIIKVNGTEYIKTVDNKTEADNLENLPEF